MDIKQNEPGSQAVAALLSWPHGLQSLDLSSSALQPPDASSALQQWASSARKNALTHVALAGNALTEKTLQPLCAALLANRKLASVDLAACQLGAEAGRKLHSLAQSIGQIRAAGGRHHALKVRTHVCVEHSKHAILGPCCMKLICVCVVRHTLVVACARTTSRGNQHLHAAGHQAGSQRWPGQGDCSKHWGSASKVVVQHASVLGTSADASCQVVATQRVLEEIMTRKNACGTGRYYCGSGTEHTCVTGATIQCNCSTYSDCKNE